MCYFTSLIYIYIEYFIIFINLYVCHCASIQQFISFDTMLGLGFSRPVLCFLLKTANPLKLKR